MRYLASGLKRMEAAQEDEPWRSLRPEMISAVWAGLVVTYRSAPFTPEDIAMPTTGVGVSFVGDERSRHRLGLGGTQSRRLEPGSVFVFADDDFTWAENTSPYAGVALGFDLSLLAEAAERAEMPAPTTLRAAHFHRDDDLLRISALMASELRGGGPGGALYQEALATLALVRLLRGYAGQDSGALERPAGLTSAKLRQVCRFMADHVGEAVTMDQLGRLAGMSPFRFARAFKAAVGRAPHQHLTLLRMERARLMLETTALAVAEIAVRVGYASQSHFTAQFRRTFGATPAAHRRASMG